MPAEDADGLLARRRRRRSERMNASGVDTGNTADTVRMYLREIGRVDLLTPDDERRLAQAIEEGNQAALRARPRRCRSRSTVVAACESCRPVSAPRAN